MLSINWSDVWKMVESIKVPLIVIGVAATQATVQTTRAIEKTPNPTQL